MNKKIAIIGSGEMAVILADKAREMGLESHSFSNNASDRVIGYSDYHHNVDIFDIEKLVNICESLKINGVLPTTELTVNIAANLADKLGLIGLPLELSKNITNKYFVRNKIGKLEHIEQPHYEVWNFDEEFPRIKKYPIIVKPTSLGGKRGISVVKSSSELKEAIEYAKEFSMKRNNTLIIEEFIDSGIEYSVESLSFKGKHYIIQITEKITSGTPHCVELGHLQPANLSPGQKENIILGVKELLTTIGVDNTATHTEVKISNNKIYLIELNSRLGGDHISYPLTELSTGYDYIKNFIKISLNMFEPIDFSKFKTSYSGVVFITTQTKEFKPLFDNAEKYSWLYKKNNVTKELKTIINNKAFDTNYFIFNSKNGIPEEIMKILNKQRNE